MQNSHFREKMVSQALGHMKSHLSGPVSVKAVADKVGYSERHLQRAFRFVLGESVLDHLNRLRIEKAKQLLIQTNLPITDIAFETGHNSHSYFSTLFKKKTGSKPSNYRQNARRAEYGNVHGGDGSLAHREWFKDHLTGTSLGPGWSVAQGEWTPTEQGLATQGYGQSALRLQHRLPENFHLRLEFQFEARSDMLPSDFVLSFFDENWRSDYYAFAVGAIENHAAEIRHLGVRKVWEPVGRIKPNQWQLVEVKQKDENASFWLDGVELFRFRDAFLPPHSSRCKLAISTWRSALRMRNMAIEDLGFSPFVAALSRGDTLYTLGQYDKALDFYQRLHQSGDLSVNTSELFCKIGMCFLRQKSYSQARAHFGKLISLQLTDFWAQQAQLGVLETDWVQSNWDEFKKRVESLWNHKPLRQEARVMCERASANLQSRSFFTQAGDLIEFLFARETPGGIGEVATGERLAQNQTTLRLWEQAEQTLHRISASANSTIFVLEILMELYAQLGRVEDTNKTIARILKRTKCPNDVYNCRVYGALNLRTVGEFADCARKLAKIADDFPKVVSRNPNALVQQSLLLAMQGQPINALKTLDRVRQVSPPNMAYLARTGAIAAYLPHLVAGNLDRAARVFLSKPNTEARISGREARYQIKSAILHELAGEEQVSDRLLEDAAKRFPYPYINFYGELAQALRNNRRDRLEDMPITVRERCEMFYLAGLLYEKRGNPKRARALFKMAVKEDPRNYAPAFLAKQRLSATTQRCPP